MKIKNYKCKCGKDDFNFIKSGFHTGIYCSFCGAYLKWANSEEKLLFSIHQYKENAKEKE